MFTSLTIKWPEQTDQYGRKKTPPRWHAYNLIPSVKQWGDEAEFYQIKMLCWEIAGGNVALYKQLYEETRESEVMEMYGLYLAKLYPTNQ